MERRGGVAFPGRRGARTQRDRAADTSRHETRRHGRDDRGPKPMHVISSLGSGLLDGPADTHDNTTITSR